MKLSTRVRFGVRIMLQIAMEGRDKPVFARVVAERQEISEAYVDQILMPLRAGGLLLSRRGRTGGYQLAHDANDITILDIVELLEGRLTMVDCTDGESNCPRLPTCAASRVWTRLSAVIRENLTHGIEYRHLFRIQNIYISQYFF